MFVSQGSVTGGDFINNYCLAEFDLSGDIPFWLESTLITVGGNDILIGDAITSGIAKKQANKSKHSVFEENFTF